MKAGPAGPLSISVSPWLYHTCHQIRREVPRTLLRCLLAPLAVPCSAPSCTLLPAFSAQDQQSHVALSCVRPSIVCLGNSEPLSVAPGFPTLLSLPSRLGNLASRLPTPAWLCCFSLCWECPPPPGLLQTPLQSYLWLWHFLIASCHVFTGLAIRGGVQSKV